MHSSPHSHSYRFLLLLSLSLLGFVTPCTIAQQDPAIPPTPADKPGSIGHMDYGSVIAHTIHAKSPAKNTASKGLAIQLKDEKSKSEAVIVYDTDLMRVAAAALTKDGQFIDISKTNHTSYKGGDDAHLTGTQVMGTLAGPGWANPATGSFDDPRGYPNGPLPRAWLHHKGHYKHGEQVILRYTVGDCDILESPGIEKREGMILITRTLDIGKSSRDLTLRVADIDIDTPKAGGVTQRSKRSLIIQETGQVKTKGNESKDKKADVNWAFVVGVMEAGDRVADLRIKSKMITLTIPANQTPTMLRVMTWSGPAGDITASKTGDRAMIAINTADPARSLKPLIQGGPPRWKEILQTKGTLSTAKGAYVIDTLTVPEKNPWNSWMRIVGLDFFKDGTRAAVSTWNGDVWIVSGIDDKLDKLTWKRFASGLYEPLGLVIKDEQIYALGYDRITLLHDLNNDGEADYYENFYSDWITHPRAYTLCLSTDSKGNFYTIANGNRAHGVPEHGSLYRVAADGSKMDIFATGLRSANGLGVGPGDAIAVADQEGNWTPASRIDLVREGDFIGYQPHSPNGGKTTLPYKLPLTWLPKNLDNSAGDLLWVPDDPQSRWGPLKGQLLGMSYGMCRLYVVPYETVMVDGKRVEQGGVVPLPLTFSSGIVRGRFNPRDGQLYLAGLKGWQTRAAFDAGLYRVRYTGMKAHMPVAIHPTRTGMTLTFTDPLDAEVAGDVSSYEVQRWNYVYSEKYGSPEMSVADPSKQGRDAMKVKSASLSKDGKTVTLVIEDMKPVMQMMIKMNLESREGETVKHEVYHTVHVLGEK